MPRPRPGAEASPLGVAGQRGPWRSTGQQVRVLTSRPLLRALCGREGHGSAHGRVCRKHRLQLLGQPEAHGDRCVLSRFRQHRRLLVFLCSWSMGLLCACWMAQGDLGAAASGRGFGRRGVAMDSSRRRRKMENSSIWGFFLFNQNDEQASYHSAVAMAIICLNLQGYNR